MRVTKRCKLGPGTVWVTAALVMHGPLWAADDAVDEAAAFELGTVTVSATREGAEAKGAEAVLGQQDMAREQADTVSDAVRMLPGVSLTRSGARNEEMIYLRGFDSRQVPVYVDGIPLYVPYDGYVDFSRFTTFDLAEIRVAKSDASLLYGPNTLGGAINLVTRKPRKPFEGDLRVGLGAGQMRKAAINLGGNQGLWYYQVGASYLDAETFPLPKGFRDSKADPTDTGNYRAHADRTDKRLSFKLGLTPNASDEYAVGYVLQEGQKGQPVYTGTSTQRSAVRYWRWPYWDKDSLYFLSSTRIGDNNLLKTRVYHDTYKNGLDIYSDRSYTEHDPTSSYKDTSKGASVEWSNFSLDGHELSFAAHYKVDEHNDEGKFYRDVTTSLVAQDQISLGERWQLNLGLSHEKRDAKRVYYWPKGSTNATNALARLSYTLNGRGDELYGVLSRKTRFPTIKDRYSARMGRALPNPDLKPETANHFELGVQGQPWAGAQGQAALFYSRVNDQIQTAIVSSDACGGSTCEQAQNVGRTRNLGLELSLQQRLGAQWQLSTNYTYLQRTNLSDRSITLTETPRHRLFATMHWTPSADWELRATLEAEQGRRVNFDGGTYRKLGGFAVMGLSASYKPTKNMALEFGVSNLGDKWYEFADGHPMPGRAWYVHGSYRF